MSIGMNLEEGSQSSTQLLIRIESAVGKSRHMQQVTRTAVKYTDWCIANSLLAFPASYGSIGAYICFSVNELGGSTKSISNKISSLKIFSHYLQEPWLSEAELYKLKKVQKRLFLEDTVAIRRKEPFSISMLLSLITVHWDVYKNPLELLYATIMFTAHNGILRSGDFLARHNARQVKDFTWDSMGRRVTIRLGPTKAHQSGVGETVVISDFAGPSAYKLLTIWFNKYKMHNQNDWYVFPMPFYSSTGAAMMDFSQPASQKWFSKAVAKAVTLLGRNANEYSGHSFRAGGTTDLFAVGIPYPKIKSYGRWKSDAALVYYRDQIEISTAVADAFGTAYTGSNGNKR